MRIGSGRTVAAIALVGAAASVASLAALQAGRIREEWYLWCLASRDEGTQRTAARRLAEMGVVRAIPRLLDMLRAQDGVDLPGGRLVLPLPGRQPAHAVAALRSLVGPRAVPFLAPAARDRDPHVRSWALGELSRIHPDGISALGEAFDDPALEVRLDAARALAALGMDAGPAARFLVLALGDGDARVRDQAMATLRKVGAHAAIGPSMDAFERDPASRPFLAAALLDFYPSRPALREALRAASKGRRSDLVDAVIDEARRVHNLERRLEEAEAR